MMGNNGKHILCGVDQAGDAIDMKTN